jgi:CHC2 zinc finger/Toprim-like
MNCAEANRLDMVDYLNSIGYQSQKTRGNDYWFLSPFRDEKHASFKVERNKNLWYDHGIGKGGSLLDFVIEFHKCDVSEALQKLSSFHPQNNYERPRFHPNENSLLHHEDARETGIRIIKVKQPIEDLLLCRYIKQRNISKNIADSWCHEVHFRAGEKEKIYRAIGFKNNAGGYELRNESFKGSSSPKYITYMDNKSDSISIFEGFFDFLSYQFIHQNQEIPVTNFLILNSLSFFERSVLLMEKHESIHLYLDNDNAGKKWLDFAQKRSQKYHDESKLYEGYKDLNEWHISFGKLEKQKTLRRSMGRHL